MKISNLKKIIAVGLTVVGAAFTPNLRAQVTVFIEGGSASQSVLYDRATNFFTASGGSLTNVVGSGSATVSRFQGNVGVSSPLFGFNPITLDINVANGAVAGLQALATQVTGPGDTNVLGVQTVPNLVDSAASPDGIGNIDSSHFATPLPTFVVPLVYIKNANSADTAPITNLTQRQAVELETSTPVQAAYYGGTSTNHIYFVGRNTQAAVRTEIDLNIYNTAGIVTYTNNAGQPVLDGSGDPGLSSGGAVTTTVLALTNSIGTIAVQNLKSGVTALAYEGVPYSITNVINGSYPLWGYENYYYIATGQNYTGEPSSGQLAVINAFYQSVTNAAFQTPSYPVFGNNFIPNAALKVKRTVDGGPITPLGSNFQ
jgi:hypothetical protein